MGHHYAVVRVRDMAITYRGTSVTLAAESLTPGTVYACHADEMIAIMRANGMALREQERLRTESQEAR